METFLYYLLRVSILTVLFYGFYKLLFSKTTFYSINRIALFIILLTVLILPIFHFNLLPEAKQTVSVITVETVEAAPAKVELPVTKESFKIPWITVFTFLYFSGLFFFAGYYLLGLIKLSRLIKKSKKHVLPNRLILRVTDENVDPCSWWNYIIISKTDYEEKSQAVLNHEQAHILLRHSIDRLFFDLFSCAFWFNPFSWLLRRELQSVHEFQADEQVINKGIDAKQYQLLLIRKSASEHTFALANSFLQRDLHKRIQMMMKKRTKTNKKWSYAIGLPVLAIAMMTLSIPKLNATLHEKPTESTTASISNDDAKKNLMNYLIQNAKYPVIAQENGIQGLVSVSFDVDEKGIVSDVKIVRGADPSLDAEALRLIRSIPASAIGENNKGTEEYFLLYRLQGEGIESYKAPQPEPENMIVITGYGITQPKEVSENLMKYLAENIKYPVIAQENGIQGLITASYTVNEDGTVSDVRIKVGADPSLDKEVLRVVSSIPASAMGKSNAKRAEEQSFVFRLQDEERSYYSGPMPENAVVVVGYGITKPEKK